MPEGGPQGRAGGAQAQAGPSAGAHSEESLFLRTGQVSSILTVLTALKAKTSATVEEIQKAGKDLEAMLSEAQKAAYKAVPKPGNPGGGMGLPMGGSPPAGSPRGGQAGPGGGQGGPGQGGSQWQKQLDGLIKGLQEYSKTIAG
jgi:hypothetical protein